MTTDNLDSDTVTSFGDEWSRYDQSNLSAQEAQRIFEGYFSCFPWDELPNNPIGFDMGCGTGRWAKIVAPKVGALNCIEPSGALEVARVLLAECANVNLIRASVANPVLEPESQDFGYALGVLHHVPDTQSALRACVKLLKPGAPLLVYLYYAFDNRPLWFRMLWRVSDWARCGISRLSPGLKDLVTSSIALLIYWPLARFSLLLGKLGWKVEQIPLSFYRNHSLYTMRTDARDRFGTGLEQRFTRSQIEKMMTEAGLESIRFSDSPPYWCATGFKRS